MKIRASPNAPNLYITDGEMDDEIHRRHSLGSCLKLYTTFESFLTGKRGEPRRRLRSRSLSLSRSRSRGDGIRRKLYGGSRKTK